MDLRHLRYFVAVAEEGGITRAANRLRVSQPPLSRQIRDLEETLRVSLLDRSNKRIALTPAGKVFYEEAKQILRQVDEAVRRVRELSSEPSGEFRVGYSPTPSSELLPRALKHYRRTRPLVDVALLDLASNEILARLKSREIDLAIAVEPPLRKGDGLVFEPLQKLPIGLLVPDGHEFSRRASVTLEEAMSQPLVGFGREGYPDYHRWLRRASSRAGRKPRIVAQVDGAASLLAAVQAGQGVAFGPPTFAEAAGKRAGYLTIEPAAPPIVLGVLHRSGALSPVQRDFLDALRAASAEIRPVGARRNQGALETGRKTTE